MGCEGTYTLTVVFHNEGPKEAIDKLALGCPESTPELQFHTSSQENAISIDVVRRAEQDLFMTLAARFSHECVSMRYQRVESVNSSLDDI